MRKRIQLGERMLTFFYWSEQCMCDPLVWRVLLCRWRKTGSPWQACWARLPCAFSFVSLGLRPRSQADGQPIFLLNRSAFWVATAVVVPLLLEELCPLADSPGL